MKLNAFIGLGEQLAKVPEGERIRTAELKQTLNVPQPHLSTPTFYNWLNHLEFQRAIDRTPTGYFVDRRRLLKFYAAHRIMQAKPKLTLQSALSGAALQEHLTKVGVPQTVLGFQSAANEWAFFEPRRATQMYTSRAALATLKQNLPAGDKPVQVFTEDWSSLPQIQRGARITSLFLTIVDCHAHPEGGAHAAFLEKELLWRT